MKSCDICVPARGAIFTVNEVNFCFICLKLAKKQAESNNKSLREELEHQSNYIKTTERIGNEKRNCT